MANSALAWTYGFDGKLAKAPKYQELPSFDKSSNGLFRVHVRVDKLDFIWVNLDANETPEVSWEEGFAAVDEQTRLQSFDMTNYHFDHQWEMIGDYNWKTLADNYNEVSCKICPSRTRQKELTPVSVLSLPYGPSSSQRCV